MRRLDDLFSMWARSSKGQSIGFLIRGLQVRFLPGLPHFQRLTDIPFRPSSDHLLVRLPLLQLWLSLLQQRESRHAVLSGAVYVERVRDAAAWTVTHEFLQRCARNVTGRQIRGEGVPRCMESAPAERPQNWLKDHLGI